MGGGMHSMGANTMGPASSNFGGGGMGGMNQTPSGFQSGGMGGPVAGGGAGQFGGGQVFGGGGGGGMGVGGMGGGANATGIKKLASLRWEMQELLLNTVEQVVRDQNMCIKDTPPTSSFLDPGPNVQAPGFPCTFFEDRTGVKWTSMMAYGTQYAGLPTGFEWQLLAFEFLIFSLTFRFAENQEQAVYLGVACAFLCGQFFLKCREFLGTQRLSETAMLDDRFLL